MKIKDLKLIGEIEHLPLQELDQYSGPVIYWPVKRIEKEGKIMDQSKLITLGMLRLYCEHDLSLNDIAKVYGVTRAAVHQRLKDQPVYKTFRAEREIAREDLRSKRPADKVAEAYNAVVVAGQGLDQEIQKIAKEKGIGYNAALIKLRNSNPEIFQKYEAIRQKAIKVKNDPRWR